MTRRVDEFELIARHFRPLAEGESGALGLLDDAAIITVPAGRALIVTTDGIVEGVHFPAGEDPSVVAWRLLAVGLSDLAAMGAEPFVYTLALAIPKRWRARARERWIAAFSRGLAAAQAELAAVLVGGDTVATPGPLTLTVTALGQAAEGRALRRSAAKPGDAVFVSGSIGDAALGLEAINDGLRDLSDSQRQALIDRFRRPQPRLRLGLRLVGLVHAAADVSDGLIADIGHICVSSGVSATVEMSRVPLSAAAAAAVAADPARWRLVLTGGDDYELAFTAPPAAEATLAAIADDVGVPIRRIGRIDAIEADAARPGVHVIAADGRDVVFESTGFRHF